MCNNNKDLTSFLTELPKCEHHLHLEGCLAPSLLFHLSAKNNIPLPPLTTHPEYASPATLSEFYKHFASLTSFLAAYYLGISVLLTENDFYDLAWSYFTKAKKDGVVHAEVFFDPQSHMGRGITFDTVVRGYRMACERARDELGISNRLIMCFLRDHSVASAVNTVKLAADGGYLGPLNPNSSAASDDEDRVIASFGLDSTEVGYPPELLESVYSAAIPYNLHRTAHAGEEGGPSYIRGALDSLHCSRIDHGIRLIEDEALLQRVIDEKIMLTVCPLSNVCLRAVDTLADVPIREFLERGVRFSVNSDDPAYFGGFILENYLQVEGVFGLGVTGWAVIARNAVEGSWISPGRKKELLGLVEECVAKYL